MQEEKRIDLKQLSQDTLETAKKAATVLITTPENYQELLGEIVEEDLRLEIARKFEALITQAKIVSEFHEGLEGFSYVTSDEQVDKGESKEGITNSELAQGESIAPPVKDVNVLLDESEKAWRLGDELYKAFEASESYKSSPLAHLAYNQFLGFCDVYDTWLNSQRILDLDKESRQFKQLVERYHLGQESNATVQAEAQRIQQTYQGLANYLFPTDESNNRKLEFSQQTSDAVAQMFNEINTSALECQNDEQLIEQRSNQRGELEKDYMKLLEMRARLVQGTSSLDDDYIALRALRAAIEMKHSDLLSLHERDATKVHSDGMKYETAEEVFDEIQEMLFVRDQALFVTITKKLEGKQKEGEQITFDDEKLLTTIHGSLYSNVQDRHFDLRKEIDASRKSGDPDEDELKDMEVEAEDLEKLSKSITDQVNVFLKTTNERVARLTTEPNSEEGGRFYEEVLREGGDSKPEINIEENVGEHIPDKIEREFATKQTSPEIAESTPLMTEADSIILKLDNAIDNNNSEAVMQTINGINVSIPDIDINAIRDLLAKWLDKLNQQLPENISDLEKRAPLLTQVRTANTAIKHMDQLSVVQDLVMRLMRSMPSNVKTRKELEKFEAGVLEKLQECLIAKQVALKHDPTVDSGKFQAQNFLINASLTSIKTALEKKSTAPELNTDLAEKMQAPSHRI